MLGSALRYLPRNRQWLQTVGIGGLLVLLGGLILVPFVPLGGYYKRVLARVARGEYEPPLFDEWVDLFTDGLYVYLIAILYVLVPLSVISTGAIIAGTASEQIGTAVMLFGFFLGLLGGYLLPVALTHYAYHDELSAAYDFGTIAAAAFTIEYLAAFILAVFVGVVLGGIALMLTLVLIGIFLLFYVQVSVAYLWARGYANALGIEANDPA